MKFRSSLFLGVCIVLTAPNPVLAGWTCGIDGSLLPGVSGLGVVDAQLRVHIGPYRRGPDSGTFLGTALELGEDGKWAVVGDVELPRHNAKSCMNPPPDEELRERRKYSYDVSSGFEQNVEVCADSPGKRWGGISFYSGEGSWGVGGIVEQDTVSGATRYYRPRPLADASVSHLGYFGDRLWVGTETLGECGEGVAVGVLSTYFANDTAYADRPTEICGFMVSGMVVNTNAIWISTEMGLSKVSKSGDRYNPFNVTNYVPTGDKKKPMREITCDELYTELFRSSELASAPPNDSGHPYAVLWDRVSKLRPNFAWQYVRRLNGLEPSPIDEQPK